MENTPQKAKLGLRAKAFMYNASTFKRATLISIGLFAIPFIYAGSYAAYFFLGGKESIFKKAFEARAIQHIVTQYGIWDKFGIDALCDRPDFLQMLQLKFAKDGLTWIRDMDFGGFKTYYDYFNEHLNRYQKFEFFQNLREYFDARPELIEDFFKNKDNYKNFVNYLKGEELAAVKAGDAAVKNALINYAITIGVLLIVAILISAVLSHIKNKAKDFEDGFFKSAGEWLGKEAHLMPCLGNAEVKSHVEAAQHQKADLKKPTERRVSNSAVAEKYKNLKATGQSYYASERKKLLPVQEDSTAAYPTDASKKRNSIFGFFESKSSGITSAPKTILTKRVNSKEQEDENRRQLLSARTNSNGYGSTDVNNELNSVMNDVDGILSDLHIMQAAGGSSPVNVGKPTNASVVTAQNAPQVTSAVLRNNSVMKSKYGAIVVTNSSASLNAKKDPFACSDSDDLNVSKSIQSKNKPLLMEDSDSFEGYNVDNSISANIYDPNKRVGEGQNGGPSDNVAVGSGFWSSFKSGISNAFSSGKE
jgi:hypothetical protein